jgi:hypothetical protein
LVLPTPCQPGPRASITNHRGYLLPPGDKSAGYRLAQRSFPGCGNDLCASRRPP